MGGSRLEGLVGHPYFFTLNDGTKVCQFYFAVHVQAEESDTPPTMKLNPDEHQRFVWATEGEIQTRKVCDISLDFTSDEVERIVLQLFENFRGKHMPEKHMAERLESAASALGLLSNTG